MASHKPTYAQALAHAKVLHDDFQTELAAFRQNLSSHWDSCKDILETFEEGALTREHLATHVRAIDTLHIRLFNRYLALREGLHDLIDPLYVGAAHPKKGEKDMLLGTYWAFERVPPFDAKDGDDLIGGREADRVEVKKGRYTDDESGTGQGNGEQPWVFEEYDPGASGKAGPEEWWEDSEKKEANLIDLS
ncbi:hypothetical protein CCHR01_02081 [Colletotrichum chrysophilum]|uniref:Uncharacterized protein n=1 Tax=Colletotrichum chrysophilum TaxID=1836956 RepID=A0AAD9EP14_9PEZI|nr:hypothetical protein CCHR01_02081 [Colletotrichum chrysophilum]